MAATRSKTSLKVVTDQDVAPARRGRPKAKTLKAAADSSERELLVAMRDGISDAIAAGVPSHTLAPLMRQIREIDKEIRLLDLRAKQQAEEDGDCVGDDRAWDSTAI
jgi:hypothetical protein